MGDVEDHVGLRRDAEGRGGLWEPVGVCGGLIKDNVDLVKNVLPVWCWSSRANGVVRDVEGLAGWESKGCGMGHHGRLLQRRIVDCVDGGWGLKVMFRSGHE